MKEIWKIEEMEKEAITQKGRFLEKKGWKGTCAIEGGWISTYAKRVGDVIIVLSRHHAFNLESFMESSVIDLKFMVEQLKKGL